MNDRTKTAKAVRRAKLTGRLIGVGLLTYGLWISRTHITEIGTALHLSPFEAGTLFVLVDVVCLYGKLLTAERWFVKKTRTIGYRLMLVGGLLSLICNVCAGILHGGLGRAGYGAFVVAMVVLIEYATANVKGKTVNVEPKSPRVPHAQAPVIVTRKRCPDGCQCGRHNRNAARPVSPGRVPTSELNADMAI